MIQGNLPRISPRELEREAFSGGIDEERAIDVLEWPEGMLQVLLAVTDNVRRAFKGDRIKFCAISNAKSGRCPEDCIFCAQSARYDTNVEEYPLKATDELVAAARRAEVAGAREFSLVTSGRGLAGDSEFERVKESIAAIAGNTSLEVCASLGLMDRDKLLELRDAGLTRYHHNLESGPNYFAQVCSTHSFQDNLDAIRAAREAGLRVCSGGIFGLGESIKDRAEMFSALKRFGVDSLPINFLNPIPGTPLEGKWELTPIACLKIIACARLMMPEADIIICGGREVNLGTLQPLMYPAGANGALIGDYLTTRGRPAEEDVRMVRELGLTLDLPQALVELNPGRG